jgi:hypothetical protein
MKCTGCGKQLVGRQRKFCGTWCKNRDTNSRHQNYVAQQNRGVRRKKKLLELKGLACSSCGYEKNYAALTFHHTTDDKAFALDLRNLSNRSWNEICKEADKCIVLCANCHAETHNPRFEI